MADRAGTSYIKQNFWSGILFGIGIAAFLDEAIFHQLLHWHHFYDRSTLAAGLVSDGFFHAFGWFATVSGLFLFADLRRKSGLWKARWTSGVLIGTGSFNLYDGTVHHKLLEIHQVRYVDNLLIYDLVWNAVAIIILLIGLLLFNRTRNRHPERTKGNV